MLIEKAYNEFHTEKDYFPAMTLRSGKSVDSGREEIEFNRLLDKPSYKYLEDNYDGICFLDPQSWKYYLPILIEFSIKNYTSSNSMVIDSLLASLRPPDRKPSRFRSLNKEQENVIIEFLDKLAFDEQSNWKKESMLVLEEYWAPGALYRDRDRNT